MFCHHLLTACHVHHPLALEARGCHSCHCQLLTLSTLVTVAPLCALPLSLQVCQFQRLLFKHWPQLRDLSLANCAAACAPDGLRRALAGLKDAELQHLVCKQLRLVGEDDPWAQVCAGFLSVVLGSCTAGFVVRREVWDFAGAGKWCCCLLYCRTPGSVQCIRGTSLTNNPDTMLHDDMLCCAVRRHTGPGLPAGRGGVCLPAPGLAAGCHQRHATLPHRGPAVGYDTDPHR